MVFDESLICEVINWKEKVINFCLLWTTIQAISWRIEKPVKWMWLPQLLQRISTSSKPFLSTFGSNIEYFSSVESSGEIIMPHCGHKKSPFPSILAKSTLWVFFILLAPILNSGFHTLLIFKTICWFFRFIPKSLPNFYQSTILYLECLWDEKLELESVGLGLKFNQKK